ncbi:septum formation initiator family protein [Spiroplasma phoeniceum]|uniref:Uncharacterized protein n=1 Tax=Spiroplasma phoeniceum P40 TaxID=1276259 RepID=A0A345DR73_9MOLU|nr:septum formation initiator family protein [Spiroplasma phoeniceum]AXF96714.1 hypothetical protein SDAV_001761 [Spiroplasma phoeniceum P40]
MNITEWIKYEKLEKENEALNSKIRTLKEENEALKKELADLKQQQLYIKKILKNFIIVLIVEMNYLLIGAEIVVEKE